MKTMTYREALEKAIIGVNAFEATRGELVSVWGEVAATLWSMLEDTELEPQLSKLGPAEPDACPACGTPREANAHDPNCPLFYYGASGDLEVETKSGAGVGREEG